MLLTEHRLYGIQTSGVVGHRHDCLGSMWGLPRPGIEPVSPAFITTFLFTAFTTEPPRKTPLPFSIDTLQAHL